jgi:hypothetical protein
MAHFYKTSQIFILLLIFVSSQQYANDFCNINDAKSVYFIIKDIIEYFELEKNINVTKDNCTILNKNLINYYERFALLEINNKNSYNNFKCSDCDKKFKNKAFLNLHYKIFHISPNPTYHDKYYCPGDFCPMVNCDRYKNYYAIPFTENTRDTYMHNRQPVEKYQKCNPSLVGFYKRTCMKLIKDCFKKDNFESYFSYYRHLCMKIECDGDEGRLKGKDNYEMSRDGGIWDALRLIFIYIISISIFIYILIIWISKYT